MNPASENPPAVDLPPQEIDSALYRSGRSVDSALCQRSRSDARRPRHRSSVTVLGSGPVKELDMLHPARKHLGIGLVSAALAIAAGSAGAVPVVVTYVFVLEGTDDPVGLDGADMIWHVDLNTNFGGPPFFGGVVEIVNRPNGLPDLRGPYGGGVSVIMLNVTDPGPGPGGGDGEDQLQIFPGFVDLSGAGLDWTVFEGASNSLFGFTGDFFSGAQGTTAPLTDLENLPEGQFSPGTTTYGEVGSVSTSLREGAIGLRSNLTSEEVTYRTRAARGFYTRGPKIYSQPEHAVVQTGQTIELHADAIFRGAGTTFTWSLNGVPLANGGDVAGADTLTLTIANADAQDIGVYTVQVDANGGTAISEPAIIAVVP